MVDTSHQSALTHELPRLAIGIGVSPRALLHDEWLALKLVTLLASSGCVDTGCAWSSSNARLVCGAAW